MKATAIRLTDQAAQELEELKNQPGGFNLAKATRDTIHSEHRKMKGTKK